MRLVFVYEPSVPMGKMFFDVLAVFAELRRQEGGGAGTRAEGNPAPAPPENPVLTKTAPTRCGPKSSWTQTQLGPPGVRRPVLTG